MRLLILAVLVGSAACGPVPNSTGDDEVRSRDAGEGGSGEQTGDQHWVRTQRLERRTCPSLECGVVGAFFFREGAQVLERRGEWARVTQPYDASCEGGRSQYVDSGRSDCSRENGVVDGKFAEWVQATALSEVRPPDPSASATANEALVAQSDDFNLHREAFVAAANELIAAGTCTAADFREQGGFVKSMNHRSEPVYFVYCGGFTAANRLYLNVDTGVTYR